MSVYAYFKFIPFVGGGGDGGVGERMTWKFVASPFLYIRVRTVQCVLVQLSLFSQSEKIYFSSPALPNSLASMKGKCAAIQRVTKIIKPFKPT